MTDEPAQAEGATPDPSRDRARIEPSPSGKTRDLLPVLYLIGFVALAGGVYYLWQNPPEAHLAAQDASRVGSLQSQVASLRDDVGKLQQRPTPQPGPSTADFATLRQQVAGLEAKPPAAATDLQPLMQQVQALQQQVQALPKQPDLAPLTQQVQALQQQVQALPKQPDLQPLTQRLDALEKRPAFDPASLDGKFAALGDQVKQLASQGDDANGKLAQSLQALQGRVDELDRQQKAMAQRSQLASKLQGAATALAAGQKLGDIPGAPPSVARYANEAPPTEASLRESFDRFAASAQQANQPAVMENQSFGDRLWSRAQQAVTVRQGDHVLIGDPIAGTIAHAREQLDNGDLAGAIDALKVLSGPAAQAMQPWVDRARGLLEARIGIARMAAG